MRYVALQINYYLAAKGASGEAKGKNSSVQVLFWYPAKVVTKVSLTSGNAPADPDPHRAAKSPQNRLPRH
jgi:hypothetical protein